LGGEHDGEARTGREEGQKKMGQLRGMRRG
jgi:hypothetical protein